MMHTYRRSLRIGTNRSNAYLERLLTAANRDARARYAGYNVRSVESSLERYTATGRATIRTSVTFEAVR